jgi:hypothetical protein
MPVGAEPEQHEVQPHAPKEPVVLPRGLLWSELAADALHLPRRRLEPVEQSLAREPEVRALVLGRDAPLVAPPEGRGAPIRLALSRELVRPAGGGAACEGDRVSLASRSDQLVGDHGGHLLSVGARPQLDAVKRHCSPAASSRERSIAA